MQKLIEMTCQVLLPGQLHTEDVDAPVFLTGEHRGLSVL